MPRSDSTPNSRATVAVAFDKPRQRERAEELAETLGLKIAQRLNDPHDLHLAVAHRGEDDPDRLELRVNAHLHRKHPLVGGHPIAAEPQQLDISSPAGRKLNSAFFKAVGIRKGDSFRPPVIDATAGFGEDAWLLAAAGCEVIAYERNAIVHALLQDALNRAGQTHPEIAARIELHHGDLLELPSSTPIPRSATIYLDPMFPTGRKTAEKKPMRVLRWLLGDDTDADALLPVALEITDGRVVVKRPRLAPALDGREPIHSHDAKALRYDVYRSA
ncbi:MAG: class I SAM-dependent methyltransferase [Planctomycetota bacterium]